MSITGANKKGRGRPPVGSVAINVRLPPDQLARLDTWRTAEADAPSRPEAIRRLVDLVLKGKDDDRHGVHEGS